MEIPTFWTPFICSNFFPITLSPYKLVQYIYLIYYLLTMSLSWKVIPRWAVLVSDVPHILRTLSDIL